VVAGEHRVVESADELGQLTHQDGLGTGPTDRLDHLAAGVDVQQRDAGDCVAAGDAGIAVGVDLDELQLVAVFGGEFLQDRGDLPARR
jgi:hypothetical protein